MVTWHRLAVRISVKTKVNSENGLTKHSACPKSSCIFTFHCFKNVCVVNSSQRFCFSKTVFFTDGII
jgi:hypothetical protein